MSSFVIDKKEFMKVAGFVAGLQAEHRGSSWLWWYNTQNNHLYTDEEIKAVFNQVYMNNAISVMRQYKDTQMASGTEVVDEEFSKYKKLARHWVDYGEVAKIEKAMYKLASFASSFHYQTEDEDLCEEGMKIFNEVIYKITAKIGDMKADYYGRDKYICWGEYNLTEREDEDE